MKCPHDFILSTGFREECQDCGHVENVLDSEVRDLKEKLSNSSDKLSRLKQYALDYWVSEEMWKEMEESIK